MYLHLLQKLTLKQTIDFSVKQKKSKTFRRQKKKFQNPGLQEEFLDIIKKNYL